MKDKVILDTNDFPDLAEYFSRREVGDKCAGRFELSMDENQDGVVVLSIDDVKLEMGKGDKKAKGGEDTEDAAAVKLYKGKDAEAETPEEDASEAPEEEAQEDATA